MKRNTELNVHFITNSIGAMKTRVMFTTYDYVPQIFLVLES